jgi:hypothetical protein
MSKPELDFKNYPAIPKAIKGALERYVNYNIKPGGFLTRLLCGDMFAYLSADNYNKQTEVFRNILLFLYNEIPSSIYGDIKRFEEHLAKRGES